MFPIRHVLALPVLATVLFACTGCGTGTPRIEGNVSLDGAPVDAARSASFRAAVLAPTRGMQLLSEVST